ncbi:MAG TPA: glycoside hydrolase domain-containing protein, partial [Gemmatimonadales bacterium]|nr:glycoside hydrolase domain-containing protein [Gemmatimonadales bacterium]
MVFLHIREYGLSRRASAELCLARVVLVLLPSLAITAAAGGQEPVYRTGTWEADSFGNHRAVVSVAVAAPAVRAMLPWRRPDQNPERKDIWVVDAASGRRVLNVVRGPISRESGEIAFEPTSGPGDYFIYYLRYTGTVTSNYPKLTYPGPEVTAAPEWRSLYAGSAAAMASLPAARLVAFESADTLDSFYPMQVIATERETSALLARYPGQELLVFPEDRTHPIVMPGDLPQRWVGRSGPPSLSGTASRGEFYAFQLGVWAPRAPLADVRVTFSPLAGPGRAIPGAAFRCFNQGGVDWQGRDFTTSVQVPRGRIQPLWCGVQVPPGATAGDYRGTVSVAAEGQPAVPVAMTLTVGRDTIRDAGADDPWRLARLAWLDSRLEEDHGIVPPYT